MSFGDRRLRPFIVMKEVVGVALTFLGWVWPSHFWGGCILWWL